MCLTASRQLHRVTELDLLATIVMLVLSGSLLIQLSDS